VSQVLQWLAEGDLRSDGLSNEVVAIVLQQPDLLADLIEGLDQADDAVRGHTADALEKIGRSHPEFLEGYIPKLLMCMQTDTVAMVKMHLAMIFGHLAMYEARADDFIAALLIMLQDDSVFVASWAIVSLCIFGRKYAGRREEILQEIIALQGHESVAIRSKVRKAVHVMSNEEAAFPQGWIKSERLMRELQHD
jgi:HEAT repeat protein